MSQEFPFKGHPINLQGKVTHIPGDQEKYAGKQHIVALVSFFMCEQEDAHKQKLEGDKKREKRNQPWIHLIKFDDYAIRP